jgi:hypothetical protein
VKMSQGIDVTLARTLAQRKRTIASFDHIAEVFLHSLILLIYHDRPDICEQLIGLLSIAGEINRQYGWEVALNYAEVIRHKHFHSSSPRTHVLSITTSFSMATWDTLVLQNCVLNHRMSGPRQTATTAQSSGRRDNTTVRSGTCRNWNRGFACTSEPCLWTHACSKCASPAHAATSCTQPQPASSSSGPPASTGRGTKPGKAKPTAPSSGAAPAANG